MKLKLYYKPNASSLFIRIALKEGDFDNVEYVPVSKDQSGGFVTEQGEKLTDISPKGFLPVLVVDDKHVLTETVVIGQYLVDLKPNKLYFPRDGIEKYQAMALLNFLTTEMQKGMMVSMKPFSDDNVKAFVANDTTRNCQYLEGILSKQKYLLGDRFSIADGYAYFLSRYLELCGVDMSKLPNMSRWRRVVEQLDFVQKALQEDGVQPVCKDS